MLKYIGKRLLLLIPVLLGVAFIVFTLLYITPGDPAEIMLGTGSPEALEEIRIQLGLNKPFFVRYVNYIADIIFKGDMGISYTTRQPVTTLIQNAFPNTLKLSILGTLFAIVFGLVFGVLSAVKQYSWIDNISMAFALIGISMPAFWLAMLLILAFSVYLGWLPSSGFNTFSQMILPAVTMGTIATAQIARTTRSSMLEVIRQDYIVTARSKGQKESVVVIRHALKNALIPILTVIGLIFGEMLGGAIVVEGIFSIPGVGSLMINALQARNYQVVLGGVLYIAAAFSLVNLAVDILYTYVDPRLRSRS